MFLILINGCKKDDNNDNNSVPSGKVKDIDGNIYNAVTIGTQIWMAENLKVTKYKDGSNIDYPGTDNTAWENNTSGAYAWYNNDINNKQTYGALYNWYTINTGKLCPDGWHVPTDNEWKILEGTVDSQYGIDDSIWNEIMFRGFDAGINLKSTTGWNSDGNGTDKYGFSAFPGGGRDFDGSYFSIGKNGYWWTATESSTYYGWYRAIGYNNNAVGRDYLSGKDGGKSIRCLKN